MLCLGYLLQAPSMLAFQWECRMQRRRPTRCFQQTSSTPNARQDASGARNKPTWIDQQGMVYAYLLPRNHLQETVSGTCKLSDRKLQLSLVGRPGEWLLSKRAFCRIPPWEGTLPRRGAITSKINLKQFKEGADPCQVWYSSRQPSPADSIPGRAERSAPCGWPGGTSPPARGASS